MEYPMFDEFAKRSDQTPVSRLLLVAVSMLSCTPSYAMKSPEEVYASVVARAQRVYNES